jgi:hypothetical protein
MKIQLPNGNWNKWFAWRPIKTNCYKIVWMEWVERRLDQYEYPEIAKTEYRIPSKLQ